MFCLLNHLLENKHVRMGVVDEIRLDVALDDGRKPGEHVLHLLAAEHIVPGKPEGTAIGSSIRCRNVCTCTPQGR